MLRHFCHFNSSFIPTVSFVISLPSCHVPPIMVSFNQLDQWGSGLATDPCASLSVCITVGFFIYVQRKAKLVALDNFKFLTPTAFRVWAAPVWPSFQGPKAIRKTYKRSFITYVSVSRNSSQSRTPSGIQTPATTTRLHLHAATETTAHFST